MLFPGDYTSEIFLLCCVATVLIFFIAGLLFICASSTSITWERTASRPETGLLIPSDYNSYPRTPKATIVHYLPMASYRTKRMHLEFTAV